MDPINFMLPLPRPNAHQENMSDFNDLIGSIHARQQLVQQLKGFGLAFDLAHAFSAPQLVKNPTRALLGGWHDMLSDLSPTSALQQQLLAQQTTIQGLALSLIHIFRVPRCFSGNMIRLATRWCQ